MSNILSLNSTANTTTKAVIIGTGLTVSLFFLYKSYRYYEWKSKTRLVAKKTRSAETQTDGCVESTLQVLKVNGTSSPTARHAVTVCRSATIGGTAAGPMGDVPPTQRQRTHSFRNSLSRTFDDAVPQMAIKNGDLDDYYDERSSIISYATTASMAYWECEENLHFFTLYVDAVQDLDSIASPRVDRSVQMCCKDYNDFKAKVHCIRRAFDHIFITSDDNRKSFQTMGQNILEILLNHSLRDPTECISSYYSLIDFLCDTSNHEGIREEIAVRHIPALTFYDLVLDYIILDSFDDVENPPSAVSSVASNRWLSAGFRELALQTAVSAVMRRKRSKLPVSDGFFAHFYSILDHVSPVLAWGFLGSDQDLKFKCFLVKESLQSVIRDYFCFDRCRYTNINDLCEDILRTTRERYWELDNKLTVMDT
ncbi:unnamed protein product [Medioppia subpectinata]|uniref:Uncharacterized protein n=1 Tax=Medioppia subpectinata TaxID=1979941 RepID=A0A7R9L2F4_9ACAR|nr:unnamed protein product [Medioppia subpectinata]CAG2114311.1 unnamed protein product [Medioppia subpectinata]